MVWDQRHVALLILLLHVFAVESYEPPLKFLLASNAQNGSIAYLALPADGVFSGSEKMKTLVSRTKEELVHPQGIDVDHHRKRLLVADPNTMRIVAFPLTAEGHKLTAGKMVVLAENVEARWVAVDGRGNVFFSNEARSEILKIPRSGGHPQVVYSGSAVLMPGGISTDNFNLFWTNKAKGHESGVVMTAPAFPTPEHQDSRLLAKNLEKSYGLCMALGDLYYTAPEESVYVMKRSGEPVKKIVGSMLNPRGCAWDGDSTVYVADRGKGSIFYFTAPQAYSQETIVEKAVDLENAFGVAVFSSDSRRAFGYGRILVLILLSILFG